MTRLSTIPTEGSDKPSNVVVQPLTPETWPAFVELFGPKGACAGCWCMWWRLRRAAWRAGKGAGNQRAMKKLVDQGAIPGLLAIEGERAVGWIALGPRADFLSLARSRILAPVDAQPVWSIPCFFVAPTHRRQGMSVRLLQAAAHHARAMGATILEGYPTEPNKSQPAPFVFTGLASAFRQAGFVEVARRSPTRPVMRLNL